MRPKLIPRVSNYWDFYLKRKEKWTDKKTGPTQAKTCQFFYNNAQSVTILLLSETEYCNMIHIFNSNCCMWFLPSELAKPKLFFFKQIYLGSNSLNQQWKGMGPTASSILHQSKRMSLINCRNKSDTTIRHSAMIFLSWSKYHFPCRNLDALRQVTNYKGPQRPVKGYQINADFSHSLLSH